LITALKVVAFVDPLPSMAVATPRGADSVAAATVAVGGAAAATAVDAVRSVIVTGATARSAPDDTVIVRGGAESGKPTGAGEGRMPTAPPASTVSGYLVASAAAAIVSVVPSYVAWMIEIACTSTETVVGGSAWVSRTVTEVTDRPGLIGRRA
jgi:hypothetical protein